MQRNSGTLDVPLPKPEAQKVSEVAHLFILIVPRAYKASKWSCKAAPSWTDLMALFISSHIILLHVVLGYAFSSIPLESR